MFGLLSPGTRLRFQDAQAVAHNIIRDVKIHTESSSVGCPEEQICTDFAEPPQ